MARVEDDGDHWTGIAFDRLQAPRRLAEGRRWRRLCWKNGLLRPLGVTGSASAIPAQDRRYPQSASAICSKLKSKSNSPSAARSTANSCANSSNQPAATPRRQSDRYPQ